MSKPNQKKQKLRYYYSEWFDKERLKELQITQPTLSHHMKILCDSGVVVGRKEGKWMHYSISEDGLKNVMKYLEELMKHTRMLD